MKNKIFAPNFVKLIFSISTVVVFQMVFYKHCFAGTSSPTAPSKIPHQHKTDHGGVLLMFGDAHLEIVKSENALYLYLSDKFRTPLKLSDFALEVTLISKDIKTPLPLATAPGNPFEVRSEIKSKADDNALIEIKAPLLRAPKGQISSKGRQKIALSKIPTLKAKDHSNHEGHH